MFVQFCQARLQGLPQADQLSCHSVQGFGLGYPNIYPIYKLLEHVKELVLKITMTLATV